MGLHLNPRTLESLNPFDIRIQGVKESRIQVKYPEENRIGHGA